MSALYDPRKEKQSIGANKIKLMSNKKKFYNIYTVYKV